jgi:hypothetical protein
MTPKAPKRGTVTPKRRRVRRPHTSVPVVQPTLAASIEPSVSNVATIDEPVNFQPLSRSVIFSLIWMALVVAFLFTGPRNTGPFPVSIAWMVVGATVFSLFTLGKRWPWFGLFLIMLIGGLISGGRRRRW